MKAGESEAPARAGRLCNNVHQSQYAGYDIAVGSKVSLTPQVTYAYGGIGAVNVTGAHASSLTGWKQNVIDLGLGLTLR